MAKAAARKKGASRNSRTAPRKGVPGWLWLVLGLTTGLFVAFLWHLWELRNEARPRAPAAATSTAGPDAAHPAANAGVPSGQAAAEEPRFEFYTLLPSQEVMPGSRPAPAQPTAKTTGRAYLLQAGSFKSEAEADKRRATILMLGMPVKVVKVPVKPGEAWYRVVVGPFAGQDAATTARASLKANGVDSLVIKKG